jgi:hypothetical protein
MTSVIVAGLSLWFAGAGLVQPATQFNVRMPAAEPSWFPPGTDVSGPFAFRQLTGAGATASGAN